MVGLTHFRTKNEPQLEADYDRASDVLYITLGKSRDGEGEMHPKGIMLRYSMDGDDPIGVTVVGVQHNEWQKHISELAVIVAKHVNVVANIAEKAIRQAIT